MQRAHTRMRERERERAALDTEGRSRQAGTTERAQKGAQQLRSERDAGRFIGKLRSLLGCWPGGSAAQALESLLLVLGGLKACCSSLQAGKQLFKSIGANELHEASRPRLGVGS